MFFPTSWWWQTVFRARLFPVGHYCAEAIFFPWADSKIWADSAKVIARSFRILNPNSSEETVEHVSRWRKTVLAPELRLLVNEQIYTGSPIDSEWQTKRAHTHNQYRLLKVGVWTCYETSNPEIWGKTVEHVSRWRKTVLAPELRLLVNEQIYTGSPIDSEWQTKRARTHTSSIDCESGGLNLLWDIKPWDLRKNSWACVTVTINSVGTRAETFGQWADLHWLSNWFWVTNQARTHTHKQYRLWKWGFELAMRHQTLRFEKEQLSMCHGDDKQCWHQSWDFWSMSRFTLALQLILSDKPSAHAHTHTSSIDCESGGLNLLWDIKPWDLKKQLSMCHGD